MALYSIPFEVRDYELDFQGIVNNSVYLNYLEHTRHRFLSDRNIDVPALHNQGVDLVVIRMELDYKASLRSHDKFRVTVNTCREGNLRIVFNQQIIRMPDEKLMLAAKAFGVCLRNGRPVRPQDVLDMSRFGAE
ncbi:MAG TPA: thioesterase family protein [Bacteroidales bacterium]|nr:thioesterase family protein [Bacteroidales bacterium]